MNVLVTGASGLIGTRLAGALRSAGHRVRRAVRRPVVAADEVHWDVERGTLEPWDSSDAVVHLAGASLVQGRWTAENKRRLRRSRVEATRSLATWLSEQAQPPRHLIGASGVGYYGDRGDEPLEEGSRRGDGFLAGLAVDWEDAGSALAARGTRIAHLRIGLVLAREGGALPRMLLPARLGLAGPLGDGRQFWSWIALDDVVGAFVHVLERSALEGALNAVAPEPVRQAEFARTLGRVLARPSWIPAPRFALRLVLGEMAEALLLASQRALPARLAASGYRFRLPTLEDALRAVLNPRAGGFGV